ncbi:hypothetical protein [Psychroserpens mesophilus]|uniref:hypothetical protein n=1 Tax=Psychroserpens mesophilus TaxID=325473 RepID=UPI003F498654
MKRRDFIKKTGQTLLITSVASIVGVSCSSDDDDNGMFDDGYYNDQYFDNGYYDGGY